MQHILRLSKRGAAADERVAAAAAVALLLASRPKAAILANAALLELANAFCKSDDNPALREVFVLCLAHQRTPAADVLNRRLLLSRIASAVDERHARPHALRALGCIAPLWAQQLEPVVAVVGCLGAAEAPAAAEAAAALA
eukprot:1771572-Prymnesium_polylepis.1